MKKFKVKDFTKCITIVFIVFTMLFSNIVPIISWAAENNIEEENDNIKFDIVWSGNSSGTFYAGEQYGATFSLALSGVQTGFSNLKITVEDSEIPRATIDTKTGNKENSLVNTSKSNSNTLVFKDKVDSGVSTGGVIFFNFRGKNDYQDYSKSIKVTLTGEYIDSKTGETQYICIEKILEANVQTRDDVDVFKSEIQLGATGDEKIISTSRSNQGLIGGEYVTTAIQVNSPFNISGHNVTYGEYKIKLKRITNGYDATLLSGEENCNVSIPNLPSYMNQEIKRNDDGTLEIIVSVGEEKEEYSEDDLFDFSVNLLVNVDYNVIEDTSEGTKTTSIYIEYTGDVSGYTITKGKNGTQYTEQSDTYRKQYSENVYLCRRSGDYKAEAEISGDKRTKTQWENDIKSGKADFVWTTDTLYWDRRAKSVVFYDFQHGGSHFYSWLIDVTNYNTVKYIADDGTEKEKKIDNALLLKSIEIKNWDDSWESLKFYKIDGVKGDWESEETRIEDAPVFFQAKGNNLTYTVPEGETISNYGAIIGNILYSLDNEQSPEWESVYTLNIENLTNAGLSENEIKNITSVSKKYNYSMANTRNMQNITYPGQIVKEENWENVSKIGDYDFVYNTTIADVERSIFNKSKFRVDGYREGYNTNLVYTSDEGNKETLNLTDELNLKRIVVSGYDGTWKYADFYKKGETEPFFRAESGNLTYEVPEGELITDYYVIFDYMYGERASDNSYPKWNAVYTLDINKLKENLSDEEIKNISSITKYQEGKFDSCDNWNYQGSCYINVPSQASKYSYFDMSVSKMDTSVGSYGVLEDGTINLTMNKDIEKFGSTLLENKNPKFFVQLPECFDYENISVSISGGSGSLAISNKDCTDENENAWYIDDDTGMLVINCYGDWTDYKGSANITINFKKKLNTYSVNTNNTLYAYMITSNGNYICDTTTNNKSLSKNGSVPSLVGVRSATFTIDTEDVVRIRNGIVVNSNTIYPTETSDTKLSTKENPVKANPGNTVTYKTEIAANGVILTNVSVLSKLPIKNNKSIHGDVYSLGSENTLTNLSNIKVTYRTGTTERDLNSSDYTIQYSTEQDVNFDSTWTDYVEGDSNISNAQAILVTLNSSYKINKKGFLYVYFDMTMPETDGISGQISAVKYTKNTETQATTLEPAAVYVTKGNPNGTLNVQKIFEGYSIGNTPTGISLANIEFKIKNVKTREILVLDGQTDSEGVVKTDATGKFTLTNVPQGRYEIVEVSKIDGFEGIDYTTFEVVNGETIDKNVTNKRKIVNLTIQKVWEISGEKQQGSVQLRLTRTGDSKSWNQTMYTDAETGKVTLPVPCGSYVVQEVSGLNGWQMNGLNTAFNVNEDGQTYTVNNSIQRAGLQIKKTVPNVEGSVDTVEGIKFRIKGTAYAGSYIDENGEEQYLDYDKTITVGEDIEGVTQTISEDKKQVVIYLGSVYAGNYTISEIDMPKIEVEGEQINRYADLVRSISLEANKLNELNIENVWKRGKVKITKTAEEGVELDQFKFRVHGTSYYGTQVDTIINIDSKGQGSADVIIGNYKVEEVGTNAFNTVFEITENGTTRDQADYQDIKVTGTSTINLKVRNETAYGYVKIQKTLEGNDDPSSAKGIQFEINGLAPSGENISKTITIGADGTGVSEAIPAGGEYILTEVEETVPNNYELMEEREVELTKYNTEENPLVLNIEDKRGRGKLEITTETNPEGGDVYPIVYKIQEIIVNDADATYTRIENTEKTIDGDLTGKAIVNDIPAGTYIVSQESIPTGWKKDVPQIIDVPMDNTAYATFLIMKEEELLNTKVNISKTILNPEGSEATDEDFTKYKLDKKQSFEVKLTNKISGKVYYVFTSPEKSGTIEGLPEGKYKIEETYKPKYVLNSYNIVNEEQNTKIEEENGEYIFEIGSEAEGKNIVNIQIENKINDKFGFGGQDSKDNLSKMDVEEIEDKVVTRSTLFVVDEDGNKIEGCTFELYDNTGKKLASVSPTVKQTIIKGLQPGVYTIKNVLVPEGYLLADDTAFAVYDDAVRTIRIEIQKNIPRGNLTLQTVYTDTLSRTRNVPKSQYMIVDSDSGDVIKFEKKADGSYKRSNLPNATDTISSRAGKVTLRGVETGTYEVGLVGMSDGYGLIETDDVEVAEVVKDETQDITVSTIQRKIVDIQSSNETTFVLDNTGVLWGWGYNNSNDSIGNGTTINQYEPTIITDNVSKMSIGYYGRAIIDNDGELFVWGYNNNGLLGIDSSESTSISKPTHVDLTYTDGTKVKAKEVSTGYYSTLVIDENDKLWYAGYRYSIGFGNDYENNQMSSDVYKFVCVTDMKGSPFAEIVPAKVYVGYDTNYLLDNEGKLWSWSKGNIDKLGYLPTENIQSYMATCVSLTPGVSGNDINEAYKQGIKISQIDEGLAIDENGDLYSYNSASGLSGSYAYCVTKEGRRFEGKKFKKAVGIEWSGKSSYTGIWCLIDIDGKLYMDQERGGTISVNDIENSKYSDTQFTNVTINYYGITAVDNNSKLYGAGYNGYGQTGADYNTIDMQKSINGIKLMEYQVALPNYAAYFKYDMKFQKVDSCWFGTIALDDDGNLWSWGGNGNSCNVLGNATEYVKTPRMIEFNENIKFKDITADKSGYYSMYAIDTKGRLWTWGQTNYGLSGVGISNTPITRTCVSELTATNNPLAIAYSEGTELEEIRATKNLIIARDNHNKTWLWGSYASGIVSSGLDITVPQCLGNEEGLQEFYASGKYIKKAAWYQGMLAFIDNKGMLWYYNNSGLKNVSEFYNEHNPNCNLERAMVVDGLKLTDITGNSGTLVLIDEQGKVWYKDSNPTSSTCYSTAEDSTIANEYMKGNKFVSVDYDDSVEGSGIDSNGHIWTGIYSANPTMVADQTKFIYANRFNDSYKAIDEDGHMWIWGDNSGYKLGTGTTANVDTPTITTGKTINDLYGMKFIDVNSSGAESDEGYMYYIYRDVIRQGTQTITYLKNQGIEIKQQEGRYAIDTEGKLYYLNVNGEWQCITETEGNDINSAYYNDNIRINEIIEFKPKSKYYNESKYYFIDSNGRLWGTDYKLYGNFNFERIVSVTSNNCLVIDRDGNYWINGSNAYGLLGNGDLSVKSSDTFMKISLNDDVKISDILFFNEYTIYVKDTNGVIWAWGCNHDSQVGASSSIANVSTPYCWEIQADQIFVKCFEGYTESTTHTKVNSVIVLDTDGCVWTAGYGGHTGDFADGIAGKNGCALGKVSNSASMGKIVKLQVSVDCAYAINEDGDMWVWGANSYGALGYATSLREWYTNRYTFTAVRAPVCLTNTQGTFYKKKIKDVIDITRYWWYNDETYKMVNEAGSAAVLVITEDGEVYGMGNSTKYVDSYARDMYTNSNTSYPTPRLFETDGKVVDVYRSDVYQSILKTDTGKIYVTTNSTAWANWLTDITKDEYADMTLEEILEDYNASNSSSGNSNNSTAIDEDNHTITYKSGSEVITYEYPENINPVKVYADRGSAYIVDENNDLWIKGNNTGRGVTFDTFRCITKEQYSSDPIWNTIRGRWNVIYRKY